MLSREDWLLIFIGLPGGEYETDQLRIMKGLFLVSKEGPEEVRDLYDFQPYDYGPFDTHIYDDLDKLEGEGLILADATATNRRIFSLTERGSERFADLEKEALQSDLERVAQIKKVTTSMSFLDLLKYVYRKYPDYAVRSKVSL